MLCIDTDAGPHVLITSYFVLTLLMIIIIRPRFWTSFIMIHRILGV